MAAAQAEAEVGPSLGLLLDSAALHSTMSILCEPAELASARASQAVLLAVYVNSSKSNAESHYRASDILMQEVLLHRTTCPATCRSLPCRRCVCALLGWKISWHRCRQFARQIARATSLAGRNYRWAVQQSRAPG